MDGRLADGKFAEGNQISKKLTTPELKEEAYRQYCQHLSEGWPKEAFFFDHEELQITWKTMDKYIRENPADFPSIKMETAQAKRYKHWLTEGQTLMKGGYQHGSPVVWQTFMRNMFKDLKWDQKELDQDSNRPSEDFKAKLHSIKELHVTDVLQSKASEVPQGSNGED